ncbi:MAG: hypothetical protein J5518_06265 [Lachnospiraceae bacterium]|nr:hypothetical protein [Lachnospiraceae bacterium]
MHKEVKNDNVLRAITIGIAAMMATASMPTTVLANENPETPEPAPVQAPESSRAEESLSAPASENTVTQSVADMQSTAADLVTDSSAASGLIADVLTDAQTTGDAVIIADLIAAQQALEGSEENAGATAQLNDAASLMNEAAGTEAKADILINTADETTDALIGLNEDYNKADQKVRKGADDTVTQANIANTSNSKKEAYNAKDVAAENLELVKEGFEEANKAYADALVKAGTAETEYEAAEAEHKAALEKVEEAKAKLMEAQMNSIAASEMLKAAQDRADSLERRVKKLEETSEQLEAIRTQYYAMMVQYYRTVLGANGTVYHDDGTLDVEACAQKITEQQVNGRKGVSDPVMKLGRDLMQKLVEYQVMTDENVDFENSGFAFAKAEEGNTDLTSEEAREGKVFESSEYVKDKKGKVLLDENGSKIGKEQVVVDQDGKNGRKKGRVDDDGNTIMANEAYSLYMEKSTLEDNGRTNRFKLTYTDKDGNEHTTYYNYIFKSSAAPYKDTLDMETGPIYLAEVKQDENGNWYTDKVLGEDNFSDYGNLLKAIDSVKKVNELTAEYESAKLEVQKAVDKVDSLTEEIEALQAVKADSTKLDELRQKLDQANEELNEATKKKVTLQDEVDRAQEAFDSIDLSRFNKASGGASAEISPVTSDGSAESPVVPGAADSALAGTLTASIPTIAAPVTGGAQTGSTVLPGISGVAGARTEDTGAEEVKSPIVEAMEKVAEKETEKGAQVETMEEGLLPGAQTAPVEDKEGMNLWWLLVVALLGATGKAMYEKHKEKERAKANPDAYNK